LYPNSGMIDTVIAKDSRLVKSFRFGIYPEYKLTRKINRAKKMQYQIGPMFDELYTNVYPSIFDNHTMQLMVDGAEGDDVIASLARSKKLDEDYGKIILISSDRDFVQLQMDRPISQFDIQGEEVLPKLKHGVNVVDLTPQQALMIKIISGDSSDNIKPIKPKIGEIRAYRFITENTDGFKKLLKEEPEVAERFIMNTKLIDFRNIPSELSNKVVDEFYTRRNW